MADHLRLVHARDVKPTQSAVERPEMRSVDSGAQHQCHPPHRDWIDYYAFFWSERLDNLKTLLEEIGS
jgi:hypothetical protein